MNFIIRFIIRIHKWYTKLNDDKIIENILIQRSIPVGSTVTDITEPSIENYDLLDEAPEAKTPYSNNSIQHVQALTG